MATTCQLCGGQPAKSMGDSMVDSDADLYAYCDECEAMIIAEAHAQEDAFFEAVARQESWALADLADGHVGRCAHEADAYCERCGAPIIDLAAEGVARCSYSDGDGGEFEVAYCPACVAAGAGADERTTDRVPF